MKNKKKDPLHFTSRILSARNPFSQRVFRRSFGGSVTVLLLVALLYTGCAQQYAQRTGNWPSYASDNFSSKYSSLDEINKENAKRLRIAWTWESPDNGILDQLKFPVSIYEATPLAIDGILYISSSTAQVSAVDGATGKTIWKYDPEVYKSTPPAHGAYIHRGVSYWRRGDDRRIIFATPDARLIALHAEDGTPVDTFGNGGVVDLTAGLGRRVDPSHYAVTSPPLIANDVIVVGSSVTDGDPESMRPPGDVRGFDAGTGKQRWVFHTIPHPGEEGNNTWEGGAWKFNGNTNVWTPVSADEKLGYVYLPVSTPTNDLYGGNRHGDNLYAESLVCLDIRTGEKIWHYQTVHHGLWNYDLPAAPNLVDVTIGGKRVKAVAQVTKQGFTFVFDRKTGKPLWPIEERPVPASAIPGEKASPTQPFPTKPLPFERQGAVEANLIDFTPSLRADAMARLDSIDTGGLYEVPTERGLVYLPGALGGANWHGAATDPATGVLYVPSITFPTFSRIIPSDPEKTDARFEGMPFWIEGPQGLPLFKPPYGRVTAIDLNTGEHRWMSPLGEGPRDHPLLKDLDLPALGSSQRGSPLLTKTLLFIGQEGKYWEYIPALVGGSKLAATGFQEDMVRFDPRLYVFDKESGAVVHSVALPLNVTGAPMTYRANGKQYIAFAVGGAIAPARIIALSL